MLSQDSTIATTTELSGSMLANNSSMTIENAFQGKLPQRLKMLNISAGPTIIVPFADEFQLRFDFEYLFKQTTMNFYTTYTSSAGDGIIESNIKSYDVVYAISIGPQFNQYLLDNLSAYCCLQFGLGWGGTYDSRSGIRKPWDSPEIRFPTVSSGLRYFVSSRTALRIEFKYRKTAHASGFSEANSNELLFGAGLSIFVWRIRDFN